ncbi:MAG TPA: rhomboid family intramembrane serine protease [Allosphingosinicella sp.]|jgi:membrane associated rhomboid family serine protease
MRPPDSWKRARLTLGIAGVAAFAWLVISTAGLGDVAMMWAGFIPARVGGAGGAEAMAPLALTPLTATLVHIGFLHLALNLVILLVCGRPVENILGWQAILILFLAGAYAAAAAHYGLDPSDMSPMVGVSGSVSAVLGAYAMLFSRFKVKVANPTLGLWLNILWLGAAWILFQLAVGFTFERPGAPTGVAAHIGGFLAGLVLAKPLLLFRYRRA